MNSRPRRTEGDAEELTDRSAAVLNRSTANSMLSGLQTKRKFRHVVKGHVGPVTPCAPFEYSASGAHGVTRPTLHSFSYSAFSNVADHLCNRRIGRTSSGQALLP